MIALRQTNQVRLRYLRALLRQPAFIVITLIQPMIWLLLFGALFKAVTQIPGFDGRSYIDFLTPGVVVMLAVSSAGWTGMGFIEDINCGVMDRMLVSPAWRGAFNLGSVAQSMLSVVIQTVLIVVLALALGADYAHGVGGVLVLLLVAALLAAIFASFRNGIGVLTRQRETLIGAVRLFLLPLTFLSSALMQPSLAPGWIGTRGEVQPGQLGRDRRALGDDGLVRLGARRLARRPAGARSSCSRRGSRPARSASTSGRSDLT